MANPKAGRNKPGHKNPAVAAKWAEALSLRLAGRNYQEIAAQLGYADHSGAHRAVMDALQATLREPADSVRVMEAERLDRLMAGIWDAATRGEPDMIDRVLKIMDRRSKLLGLDAPQKVAPTNPEGTAEYPAPATEAERVARIAELLASAKGRDAPP